MSKKFRPSGPNKGMKSGKQAMAKAAVNFGRPPIRRFEEYDPVKETLHADTNPFWVKDRTIAAKAQSHDEDAPCLADLTIGAMGNPKRGLVGYRDSKDARRSVHGFRQKMLNAHRFELTPELIHAVTLVASSLNTATLVTMAENARPCFDSMWIEWDEQVRRDASIAIQRKVHGHDIHVPSRSQWCDRVGYLVQNVDSHNLAIKNPANRYWPGMTDKDAGSSFIYTGVLLVNTFDKDSDVPLSERAGPAGVMAAPIGYLFNNESPLQERSFLEALLHFVSNKEPSKVATEYLEALNSEEELVVEVTGGGPSFVKRRSKTLGESVYGAQLCAFLSAINIGWVGQIFQVEAGETPVQKDGTFTGEISFKGGRSEHNIRKVFEKFWSQPVQPMDWMIRSNEDKKKLLNDSMGLIADDLRFLITAMAMLNFTWISADPARRSDQKKIINGKVIPRNEYRRLRIGLPPNEMEKKIRGVLSGRMPSRQHDVRGHFRKMSSGKRIWIHAHVRGDPSLGIIRKEYVLDKETEDRR